MYVNKCFLENYACYNFPMFTQPLFGLVICKGKQYSGNPKGMGGDVTKTREGDI